MATFGFGAFQAVGNISAKSAPTPEVFEVPLGYHAVVSLTKVDTFHIPGYLIDENGTIVAMTSSCMSADVSSTPVVMGISATAIFLGPGEYTVSSLSGQTHCAGVVYKNTPSNV